MAHKKIKGKQGRSFLWNLTDRIAEIVYSFFVHGRVGEMLSSSDSLCKNNEYEKRKSPFINSILKYPAFFLEQSRVVRFFAFLCRFFATLKLNVYGIFFLFYGFSSFLIYLIPALISGFYPSDEVFIISAQIIMIAAIPLLFSSQSAIEGISSSIITRRILIKVLCIPDERLKVKKQYGGTWYMFLAAIMAILFGLGSAFTNPLFLPVVILCILAAMATFSFPEIGVIVTLAMVPFMKYLKDPEAILLAMVIITLVSYMCKVFQHKRTFRMSTEILILILFCGFIVTGGMFSYGGAETLLDSISSVVIIFGGFLLVYNLINTEKLLSSCVKTITVSYLILCLVAIWEGVYYGISERIIDSVGQDISVLTDGSILYLSENGRVFGMFAVFVLPLLFAYMSKRKSVQGAAAVTALCVLVASAAWMCSNYEIIVALVIECIIFWILFSHRTMTVVIFALIPIGIVALLYPVFISKFGLPNISELLMEYMPAGIADSERHLSVTQDVIKMISDGHFFGIGAGDHAFNVLFPAYTSVASAGVSHPTSFWLQITCWAGIFGLISFVVLFGLLIKRSLGFLIRSPKNELRSKALALFCGITVSVLLGGIYSIWEDMRVMFLFWTSAGLLMGYIRMGDTAENIRKSEFNDTNGASDVEVVFYN